MGINERLEYSLQLVNEFDNKGDRGGMYCDLEYPYRYILGGMPVRAIRGALQAQRDFAASYRDFNVGAAVAGFNPSTMSMDVFTGANFKVDRTDLINIHAEDVAIGKAKKFGCTVVPLLVVVGEVQEDHASGLICGTLHPCGRCRKMLGRSDLINGRTIIMSSTPDLQKIEIYSLEELCKLHDTHVDGSIQLAHLRPFQDTGNPEETDWDIDWDKKVTPILAERYDRALRQQAQRALNKTEEFAEQNIK